MTKKQIAALLKKRLRIYRKDRDSKEVDKIKDKILAVIKKNFNSFEVDFIIETLTKFGDAPCVMYDDNGLFAVSGDGFQPVVMGDQKIEGGITVMVKKTQWKRTMRAALKHYMEDGK